MTDNARELLRLAREERDAAIRDGHTLALLLRDGITNPGDWTHEQRAAVTRVYNRRTDKLATT